VSFTDEFRLLGRECSRERLPSQALSWRCLVAFRLRLPENTKELQYSAHYTPMAISTCYTFHMNGPITPITVWEDCGILSEAGCINARPESTTILSRSSLSDQRQS